MKSTYFKYLFSLIAILGLFLTSCTNTTEPVSDNIEGLKKIDYAPTVDEAQTQAQSLITESFKTILEGSTVSNNSSSLGKNTSNSTYSFISGWHTWRGDLIESPFEIQDSYMAQYLAKIQFQDASQNVQVLPDGAKAMLVYLNAHAAFGFVGDDPSGDERWYDFNSVVTPLTGNPSMVSAQGTYERRWVGEYSADGENWELVEIQNKFFVSAKDVKFFYDYVADDYYLLGNITVTTNGIKILARFSNSRTALLEIYQNDVLVSTAQLELPNFYQMFNVPSLENWNFGSGFIFPTPIIF
ncbi:MAG: hypothetical protein KDC52_16450 [Ignavibacteriae bacterium]|nr:hypothetical protein [Ignavibacteriota bacterium]MCB0753065.1 hypothetical protein [Ignavibacteriota bacterium]